MKPPLDHRATIGEAICPYCGVGCRLWAEAAYGQVLRVKGAVDAPANKGGICAKGATLPQVLHSPDRLTQPQFRTRRDGAFKPASWDQAMGFAAQRLKEIIGRFGPDSVGFYGSGQLDSEAVYVAVKLFKGLLGTNNTDSNSRLCMASAVAGYVGSLGSDGPPTCYEDVDHADLILIVGSNMVDAHPVIFDQIKARRGKSPNASLPFLVVVDPRRTRTAEAADLHLPIAPGGDVAFFNYLAKRLLESGKIDPQFASDSCNGLETYSEFLRRLSDAELLAAIDVDPELLESLVARIGRSRAMLSFYCMGLGQSTAGVAKHQSLINLHLLTGQIAKPGAGPFSLTGQPNAMGGREGGLLAHQLPGYRLVADSEHRRQVEQYWRLAPGSISSKPGLTAVEMFRALESGRLKAIWIAATNPMVSLPDLHQTKRALQRAELVVVQDPYHPTETTQFADVLFPVANWAEKEWTSTNSERMVSYSDKLLEPPGSARSDWEVLVELARKLGLSGCDFKSASDVWNEYIALTADRPTDMRGVTAARLRREKNLQWPCPTLDHPGSKRRYLDRRFPTKDGKARFVPHSHAEARETPDHEFPFILTTGRLYAHWHTLTRTGKSPKLLKRDPEPYVEMHPDDAERLAVAEGSLVRLQSRRGTVRLPVRLSPTLRPGLLFAPFHWGDQWGEDRAVNYLTISAFDPISKQPELKYCCVSVEPIQAPALASAAAVGEEHSGWLTWLRTRTS